MIDPTALPGSSRTGDFVDDPTTYQGQDVQARKPGFSFPAPRPSPSQPPVDFSQLMQGAGQGKGGLNLNSIMPLLLLAAPLIEAHNPGAGMAMASNYLNYTRQQADQKQRTILGMAHEFANTTDEQWPAVEGLLRSQGLGPDVIRAIKEGRTAFRDPNWETEQQFRQIFGPGLDAARQMGVRFTPTPEQVQAAQRAGLQIPYDVQGGSPAIPAQPGGGELGTRTPPVPAQAAVPGQVVLRGTQAAAPTTTIGQVFSGAAGTPFANLPANPANTRLWMDFSKNNTEHKKEYQAFLREKMLAGLRLPGSVNLAELRTQMESPEAGMSFAAEFSRARDAMAKLPVPVTINGQTQMVSPDKAADIALRENGMVTVPLGGGRTVQMTGAQYANFQIAQQRLAIAQAREGRAEAKPPKGAGPVTPRGGAKPPKPVDTAKISGDYESVWNGARATFPPNVTDAMQRAVHGQATPADNKLLQGQKGAAPYVTRLTSLWRQLNPAGQGQTAQPAAPAKPAAPPSGAQQQTFTKGGFPVYMVNGRYWSNGRFLDPKTGEPIP